MKRALKPLLYIVAGVVIGFLVISMAYYGMVRTSTPQFCASCHEIVPAYDSWKTSTHANNSKGFVAGCMDCHLPAPEDTIDFFYAKTAHGLKDLILHFVGAPYDRQKAREAVYSSLENQQCTKCHGNILYIPESRGAMLAHKTVLYPRKGYEKSCADCHRDLVHEPTRTYRY